MKRFNARAILLLLLAACFIASAFIPDFGSWSIIIWFSSWPSFVLVS